MARESRRPSFASDFPRVPELDALVEAFERGDYARVRAEAPKLASSTEDAAVRDAARTLVDRTRPDRLAVGLVGLTGVLLVVLSAYWIFHGKAPEGSTPPRPTIERVAAQAPSPPPASSSAMSRVTDADCAKWADHATDIVVGGFVDATQSCSQKVKDDVAAKFVAQRSTLHDGAKALCAQHMGQPYRPQDGACFLAATNARDLVACKLGPMTSPADSDWAQMIDDLRKNCAVQNAPSAAPSSPSP
jgi:hypothetical protein